MAISPSGRLKTQTKRQNKFQCLSCKSSPSAGQNAAVPPRWQAYATACRTPCPCRTPFWTANTAATANKESCSEDGTTVFLAGRPKCKIWQALPVKLNGGFEFSRQADRIDIYFTDQRGRRQTRKKLFVLAKGQTAQLCINERACGFDDTYYTQHTYNFAHADNVPREIFTQRGFDHSVSLENHLF